MVDSSQNKIPLFKAMGLTEEQVETMNSYYIRLASEHYQKLGALVGEKFNSMAESSEVIKPETKHVFEQIKQHKHLSAFLKDLESHWKQLELRNIAKAKSVNEFTEFLIDDVQAVIKALEEEKLKILTRRNLHADVNDLNDDIELSEVVITQPQSFGHSPSEQETPLIRSELSEKNLQEINEKITSGQFILEYLKNFKILRNGGSEAAATEAEKQAAKSRWLKAAEWLEKREKIISSSYFGTSFTAVYYRSFGDGVQANRYSGGGRAPFATVVMGNVAIDFLLACISVGSVVAQVTQAAGWNADLARKLEMIDKTRDLPGALSLLSPELQSRLIQYYLLSEDDDCSSFTEAENKNPYPMCSSSEDTCADLWSFFCCKMSPVTDSMNCPGPISYFRRVVSAGNRLFADDTVRGGIGKVSGNYNQKIRDRITSSLVRLVCENTPKSMNNIWGPSIWQQITAILIHAVDGPIALAEIGDMGAMQQAQTKLHFAMQSISKLFDNRPLTPYEKNRIIEMFGSVLAAKLGFSTATDDERYRKSQRSSWLIDAMANVLQIGATGVMLYDWYFYLFNPLMSAGGLVDGVCDASTAKKMPDLGKTDSECFFARFADSRKNSPEIRLLNVIGMKVGALFASILAAMSSNMKQGKLSPDEFCLEP